MREVKLQCLFSRTKRWIWINQWTFFFTASIGNVYRTTFNFFNQGDGEELSSVTSEPPENLFTYLSSQLDQSQPDQMSSTQSPDSSSPQQQQQQQPPNDRSSNSRRDDDGNVEFDCDWINQSQNVSDDWFNFRKTLIYTSTFGWKYKQTKNTYTKTSKLFNRIHWIYLAIINFFVCSSFSKNESRKMLMKKISVSKQQQ